MNGGLMRGSQHHYSTAKAKGDSHNATQAHLRLCFMLYKYHV